MTGAPISTLYGLRDIDQSQPQWSVLKYYKVAVANDVLIASADLVPPDDKLWWITNVFGLMTPGATVKVQSAWYQIVSRGQVVGGIGGERISGGGADGESAFFNVPITDVCLIGGFTGIKARFNFSAADPANQVAWGFNGYVTPKGNVLV